MRLIGLLIFLSLGVTQCVQSVFAQECLIDEPDKETFNITKTDNHIRIEQCAIKVCLKSAPAPKSKKTAQNETDDETPNN